MDKNDKKTFKTLNNMTVFDTCKNEYLTVANGSIPISNDNKKQSQYIIVNNKKILKRKLPIPNTKCHFIKPNNNTSKQKKIILNKENSLNKKVNVPSIKRHGSGLIRRNKNYQLPESKSGKISPNRIVINNQKQIGTKILKTTRNSPKERNEIKLLPNKTKKIPINQKNNNNKNYNSVQNYNNIGIKIIQNNKNNDEFPKFITKIIRRTNIKNDNINNTNYNNINCNNNKNINIHYNNKVYNQNVSHNSKKIFINKKDMKIINKKFHLRSPSFNSPKLPKVISPIRIRNHNYEKKNNINKLLNIPLTQTDISNSQNDFPDNYSYHEISNFNSPKKITNSINTNQEEQYMNKDEKNDYYVISNKAEYNKKYNENNYNFNYMKIPSKRLIHNQSFSHFNIKPPINDLHIPYYSTLYNNKKQPLQNTINANCYNSICFCEHKTNNNYYNENLILSKPDDQFIQISNDTLNEDVNEIPQTIHYFGEQMLKRNKNYNFPIDEKTLNSIKNLKNYFNNDYSYNNINQHNYGKNNFVTESLNIEKTDVNDKNGAVEKYLHKNFVQDGNFLNNKKNKRYTHNIFNRKKKKKLVMEKGCNEEFISNSNKKENKIGDMKDKISYYDCSIIDNDSLHEIIQEFEREIEDEERRNNNMKIKNIKNGNKKINISNTNDSIKFSFFSDNDYSIISKDSNNNNKTKKRKIHYYKTRNVDMEKNYDFVIYGTKRNKSLKK